MAHSLPQTTSRRKLTRRQKACLMLGIMLFPLLIALLCLATWWIYHVGKHAVIQRQNALPEADTAMVLGCSPTLKDGRSNLFFKLRMDAAAELYHVSDGKIKHLILSGDRSGDHYDEPEMMKRALMEHGVPEECLIKDGEGKRTLESLKRASQIFGVKKLILVTQKDHALRAHYLAHAFGIESYIWPAKEVNLKGGLRTHVREAFSRLFMLYEIHLSPSSI